MTWLTEDVVALRDNVRKVFEREFAQLVQIDSVLRIRVIRSR